MDSDFAGGGISGRIQRAESVEMKAVTVSCEGVVADAKAGLGPSRVVGELFDSLELSDKMGEQMGLGGFADEDTSVEQALCS